MKENIFILFLYLLPKNLLSRFLGIIANLSISKLFIPSFIKFYKISLEEAEKKKFKNFNDFFTRKLKKSARIISNLDNNSALCCPVDGTISQFGKISQDTLIQVKGKNYTLKDLLGNNSEQELFTNGYYITIYLAPHNYHRIHSHATGEIYQSHYIPGKLFPVNNISVKKISKLFCINERLISFINSNNCKTALVKVGATVVGKIKTSYNKIESNKWLAKEKTEQYTPSIKVQKGEELGLFELGSTVVLLLDKNNFAFSPEIHKGKTIQLGKPLGYWK